LRHRLEPIGEVEGVLWINDSKATNLSSALVALAAMERHYVLVAGGRSKGEGFEALRGALRICSGVVVYGEASAAIASALEATLPVYQVGPFDDAVARARAIARPGDAVLLSPACASFDQFANYEARGERLRILVEAM
jgi:UDP-N-acetylmuramoylalanine--D-glutamate ligase